MKRQMRLRRRDGITQRYRVGKEVKKAGEPLKFYDLKGKKAFTSGDYKIVMKNGRRFAVATSPSGLPAWRVLGKAK